MTFEDFPGAVKAAAGTGGALVNDVALRKLASIARAVPAVTRNFGFECRLGDDGRVDLGIAVDREHAAWLAPLQPVMGPADSQRQNPNERWLRIRRFAQAWMRSGGALQRWVPFSFLEFDFESARGAQPVPSVFVGLDSPIEGGGALSEERAAAEEAVVLLSRPECPVERGRLLGRAFSALPKGARVLHAAVMLGRDDESVRLSVLVRGAEAGSYLRTLGAKPAAVAAEAAQRSFGDLLGVAQLDFDLSDLGRARIGLGLRPERTDSAGWQSLLERLGRSAKMSSAKLDALVRWPSASENALNRCVAQCSVRGAISHLKLVCDGVTEPEVKAYFGISLASPAR